MYKFNWECPPIITHHDTRSKKDKIKSDIIMILDHENMTPLKEWFEIWIQLFKHITLK